MASLIQTDPALHLEIEQEFGDLQLELVHCELCALCRERHNAHYADCLLMPRRAVEALCRTHFGAADAA